MAYQELASNQHYLPHGWNTAIPAAGSALFSRRKRALIILALSGALWTAVIGGVAAAV